MKKATYLCLLMLLCLSLKAQIDPNWEPYFVEEFTSNHYWNSTNWYSMPDLYWKAYLGNTITHGDREGQIYQYDHCQFDQNEGVVKLISEFDNDGDIPNHHYDLPSALHGSYPNEFGNNITTGTQFANFDYKMKHSITIGSPEGQVIVPANTNVSMHAEQSITIDGEFEIPVGSQMSLSVHTCP